MSTNQAPQNDESQNVALIEWDGEGLPPVGTICEADVDGVWHECTLLAHCVAPKLGFAVGQTSVGLAIGEASDFRPIRTPEQIATDDRQLAVLEIGDILISNRGDSTEYHQAGLIYDAGYRKP
jgi:hypothetical protein